ncbi:zinc-binding dehydrogenase [Spirillospora sp. NPDC052269]
MKAITIPEFGDADVLRLDDVAVPEPGPGQVSIDVEYAGANFAEVLYRRGIADVPLPFVPGIEVSGRIRALGAGVDGLRVGEPVAALTIVNSGGYAEVAVTSADLVAPLNGLDLAVAAAVPSNSTTAHLVLDRIARIAPGERVLVHAAAGGVGSQLVQVARLLGAGTVVGTVGSQAKADAVRELGVEHVLLRDELPGRVDELTGGAGFDIIADMVGGQARRTSLAALAPFGRLIAMGNASGADDVPVSPNELWISSKTVSGFNLAAFSALYPAEAGRALRRAVAAVASGDLRVQVEEMPLEKAAEAHRRIESGSTTGKLVLAVRS